jgi:hypothetical protein
MIMVEDMLTTSGKLIRKTSRYGLTSFLTENWGSILLIYEIDNLNRKKKMVSHTASADILQGKGLKVKKVTKVKSDLKCLKLRNSVIFILKDGAPRGASACAARATL